MVMILLLMIFSPADLHPWPSLYTILQGHVLEWSFAVRWWRLGNGTIWGQVKVFRNLRNNLAQFYVWTNKKALTQCPTRGQCQRKSQDPCLPVEYALLSASLSLSGMICCTSVFKLQRGRLYYRSPLLTCRVPSLSGPVLSPSFYSKGKCVVVCRREIRVWAFPNLARAPGKFLLGCCGDICSWRRASVSQGLGKCHVIFPHHPLWVISSKNILGPGMSWCLDNLLLSHLNMLWEFCSLFTWASVVLSSLPRLAHISFIPYIPQGLAQTSVFYQLLLNWMVLNWTAYETMETLWIQVPCLKSHGW